MNFELRDGDIVDSMGTGFLFLLNQKLKQEILSLKRHIAH